MMTKYILNKPKNTLSTILFKDYIIHASFGIYVCLKYQYCTSTEQIDGLMQERRNSIADALELRLFCTNPSKCEHQYMGREREIKFIGLFEDRGHQGPYSPYKPFNHNLYIGIIIFPHIDNPQSTGYN